MDVDHKIFIIDEVSAAEPDITSLYSILSRFIIYVFVFAYSCTTEYSGSDSMLSLLQS